MVRTLPSRTFVDDVEILRVSTPGNGFCRFGGFSGNNIWLHGGRNAPFDQQVSLTLSVKGFFQTMLISSDSKFNAFDVRTFL